MFNFLCKASKTTDITIGENAVSSLFDILEEERAKVFIIADIVPWNLYGKNIITKLKNKGIPYSVLTISSEDKNKNYTTFAYCISKLTENSIDKNDYIMAFGGGVTGDVAGYIASVYKRGIKYIFVPTNLLAMA
ncbi:MAG: iron-containing alcohol dehydrogenase, partial [Clostridia bacterium]|nr:iron-containing alcohol dehydrogenase [Clostridia bacterium]